MRFSPRAGDATIKKKQSHRHRKQKIAGVAAALQLEAPHHSHLHNFNWFLTINFLTVFNGFLIKWPVELKVL